MLVDKSKDIATNMGGNYQLPSSFDFTHNTHQAQLCQDKPQEPR